MADVKTRIEKITPEVAYGYLDRNTHNRKVSDSVVQRFAKMMREGKWNLTHQGIAFNTEGVLSDGQHRLWAVIESGKTVEMMVTRGVEPEAMLAIDQNYARTTVDSINIVFGTKFQRVHGAVANAMKGSLRQVKTNRPDVYEMRSYLEKHGNKIEKAVSFFKPRKPLVSNASIMGVIARALYTNTEDRVQQFVTTLIHGIVESAEDTPAILLRNFILERQKGSQDPVVVYAKTERALKAFLDGDRIDKLFGAADELFPLPGEKSTLPTAVTKGAKIRKAKDNGAVAMVAAVKRPIKVIKAAARTARA